MTRAEIHAKKESLRMQRCIFYGMAIQAFLSAGLHWFGLISLHPMQQFFAAVGFVVVAFVLALINKEQP